MVWVGVCVCVYVWVCVSGDVGKVPRSVSWKKLVGCVFRTGEYAENLV
jgi:hypothetical protein